MKNLKPKHQRALTIIRNAIAHGGNAPSLQELTKAMGFSSRNSALLIVNKLIEDEFLQRRKSDKSLQILAYPIETSSHASTIEVPLIGIVSCGLPLLAEENIEATFPVSTQLARPPHRYFILRANGDSMNEAGIDDGSLVLVRQQSTANRGDRVVALVDDEATIKEFQPSNDVIALMPRSNNKIHKPIVLNSDFRIQGVVTAVLPHNLNIKRG